MCNRCLYVCVCVPGISRELSVVTSQSRVSREVPTSRAAYPGTSSSWFGLQSVEGKINKKDSEYTLGGTSIDRHLSNTLCCFILCSVINSREKTHEFWQ